MTDKKPKRIKTWSFRQYNHIRRRNPEYAGGYCQFISLLTREQAQEVRLALQQHGIRCLIGTNLLHDVPFQNLVAVHTDSNFFTARAVAERVLEGGNR